MKQVKVKQIYTSTPRKRVHKSPPHLFDFSYFATIKYKLNYIVLSSYGVYL